MNARVSDAQATANVRVELVALDAAWQEQLAHLIEFARRQSSTDNGSSSFASRLLEVSRSLPPSEVARHLSLPPRSASRTNLPAIQPQSQPINPGATRASRTNLPAVNPQSQPIGSNATRISRTNLPAVRPQSQSIDPGATRTSRTNLPAVRPQSQSIDPGATRISRTNLPAVNPRSPSNAPAGTRANPATVDVHPRPTPGTPPRPTDALELKRLLTEIAHKRYDVAIGVAQEMLCDNPGDVLAERWQNVCLARLAVARHEPSVACKHYEQVLLSDPNDREAREFVRTHRRDEKLSALPFGRFFTKPKRGP
jgi:hypothetical protein